MKKSHEARFGEYEGCCPDAILRFAKRLWIKKYWNGSGSSRRLDIINLLNKLVDYSYVYI